MSYNPNQPPMMGHAPPRKDNTLLYIFVGLGCFGALVLLCFGGFAFMAYQGFKLAEQSVEMINENPAYEEARRTIQNSEAVAEAVGEPVVVDSIYTNVEGGDAGKSGKIQFVYDLGVSGPKANGNAKIVVEGELFSENWDLESVSVTVDGEEIQLENDGETIDLPGLEGNNEQE